MSAPVDAEVYDPFSPETMADPATAHQRLLEHCPVHLYTGFGPPFYSLSRYDDVLEALRDSRTYSSHYGQGPAMNVPGSMQSDPPQHTFFRRLESVAEKGQILISASTYERVKHKVNASMLDPIKLKGKAEKVIAYSVEGLKK